jgi:hypothetical protein
MAKKIGLTKGKYAIVDDDDFDWLNSFRWTYGNRGYAFRGASVKLGEVRNSKERKTIYMHKFILGIDSKQMGDHINGNRLDNRMENLRIVTPQQNSHNSFMGFNSGSSKYKGIGYYPNKTRTDKGWRARICLGKKSIFLGYFRTELEAALAYDIAAIYYFGDYAKTNFPKYYPKGDIKVAGINYNYSKEIKTSKYKGVTLDPHSKLWDVKNKWRVQVTVEKKNIGGGKYETELEAAKKYDKLAMKLLGEKAKTNFKYKPNGRFVLSRRLKLQSY